MKKAVSAATSAALLASLLATAVAPSAFASIAVAGVGTIPQGGTSATTATFTFTENSAAALATTGSMTVTITPAGAPPTGTVTFVGTPVISAPGSLGASVSAAGSVLTITVTGHATLDVETIVVTGLKIKASSDATAGAIVATLGGTVGVYSAFQGGTYTATGKLAQAYGIGTTSWSVAVDATSLCDFAGINTVTVGGETRTPTSVGLKDLLGQQLFATNAFAVNHLANDVVTQSVPLGGPGSNCSLTTLASPGTVGVALAYRTPSAPTVYPGETYGDAGDLIFAETTATGPTYLAKDSVITATIATDGVTFSQAPTATGTDDTTGTSTLLFKGTPTNSNPALGILSADKKSATWTIATAYDTGLDRITIGKILYDVASSVVGGTEIKVAITVSGKNIYPASRTNAVVGRPVTASATATTVYIGENGQAGGTISIIEKAAGTFTDGTGNYNTFEVCIETGENFSVAPSATVTAGDLKLRSGAAAVAPGTAVVGTPFTTSGYNQCYYWTVWTASAAASTIQITTKLDVPSGMPAGNTNVAVGIGSVADFDVPEAIQLKIATRVFRYQVAVTALSQPTIPVGSNGTLAGDIQIQETANGQLKAFEPVCVEILPNQNYNLLYDAFLKGVNTADIPTVEGSNGIVVSKVLMNANGEDCRGVQRAGYPGGTLTVSFKFTIWQQSTTGNGKVVISNIKYATVNDAVEGPVQVNVYGFGENTNTLVQFQSLISNAKIGVAPKLNIAANSALGLNPTSGYTAVTPKTQAVGKYVTWKFTGGKSLAGQRVNVLVAKKFGGAWGGPVYYKSVWADANGIVTFAWTSKTAAAINVRVQWPGTTAFAVSTSKALGAYYK